MGLSPYVVLALLTLAVIAEPVILAIRQFKRGYNIRFLFVLMTLVAINVAVAAAIVRWMQHH